MGVDIYIYFFFLHIRHEPPVPTKLAGQMAGRTAKIWRFLNIQSFAWPIFGHFGTLDFYNMLYKSTYFYNVPSYVFFLPP